MDLLAAAADSNAHDMLVTMFTAISAGILVIAIAHKIHVSAIVLLLAAGVALGPEGVGIVQADMLGDGLQVIVSLAVGLILFEGGLTLDREGYRSASAVIRRLLSVGVLVTWFCIALAIGAHQYLTNGTSAGDPMFWLLAGGLVIVTGPTVIGPLLKRIRVNERLHAVLHWEGVLIDPIGVFLAILCFELYLALYDGNAGASAGAMHDSMMAVARLLGRVFAGLAIGGIGGLAVDRVLKYVPRDMLNAFSIGSAVLVFGLAEIAFHEAGLLAVTVAGFVLGLRSSREIKALRQFKAEITELLVGMLFILLASRLKLQVFFDFGVAGALLVAAIMLIVRPLNIMASTWRLDFNIREKAFLSWVAPRGIVAASMASLFALQLAQKDVPNAKFLETFTYSVIVGTVVIQGFTAGPLAALLKVRRPPRRGWLIVGAGPFAQRIARFLLDETGSPPMLVDANKRNVQIAKEKGLHAIQADARDVQSLVDMPEFLTIGYLLALTDNAELNTIICNRWEEEIGRKRVFRWGNVVGRGEHDEDSGVLVWSRLPRPSALGIELERDEMALIRADASLAAVDQRLMPLLAVHGEDVELDPGTRPSTGGVALYARRESDQVRRSIRPEFILTLTSSDIREVIGKLLDAVDTDIPEQHREALRLELTGDEAREVSGFGNGVAVPHAYVDGLMEPICAIARVSGGVDVQAPDDDPVQLIFLLLSRGGDSTGHLTVLADIARLASHPAVRDRVLAAETEEAAVTAVRDFFHGQGGGTPTAPLEPASAPAQA